MERVLGARLEKMSSPAEETIRLLAQGRTLQEIAQLRERELASTTSPPNKTEIAVAQPKGRHVKARHGNAG